MRGTVCRPTTSQPWPSDSGCVTARRCCSSLPDTLEHQGRWHTSTQVHGTSGSCRAVNWQQPGKGTAAVTATVTAAPDLPWRCGEPRAITTGASAEGSCLVAGAFQHSLCCLRKYSRAATAASKQPPAARQMCVVLHVLTGWAGRGNQANEHGAAAADAAASPATATATATAVLEEVGVGLTLEPVVSSAVSSAMHTTRAAATQGCGRQVPLVLIVPCSQHVHNMGRQAQYYSTNTHDAEYRTHND